MVCFVYRVAGCNLEHLLRRFFPTAQSGLPFGPSRSAYSRVRKLIEAGYLQSHRPQLSATGSSKRLLSVGPASLTLLTETLEISSAEFHKARHQLSPSPAEHHFATLDFYLSLELSTEQTRSVELTEWIFEHELKSSPIKVDDPATSRPVVLIPDGAFTLRLQTGESQQFYLELDRGTVAPKRVREKLRGYLVYLKDKRIPVLWVVPDEGRQERIISWASAEAASLGEDPSLFWVTRALLTSVCSILGPIWQVAGVGERLSVAPSHRVSQTAYPMSYFARDN